MQSDLGKLFIGGISWDTNEERLKEYFSGFGEVLETIIMKDRATQRARGFGFVVFADPAVADRVVKEKHNIDGRMVEAKKAVPRDDQSTISRSSSIQGSPGPVRTRKIFVGGLASTVTDSDFKTYFEQFGTITDVVVMYDHNTQRPRGFGFITYDSEDAVDKVLLKTFHELDGKMVEVKRAVPKELSPGPTRSPLSGFNYGLSRVNSFLDDYTQGYTPSAVGGYGARMDGRFSPIPTVRSGYGPFNSGYGMGLNFEAGLSQTYGGGANFNNNLNYGQGINPYYVGNSNRYVNPIGYDGVSGGNSSLFSSTTRNLWGNGGINNGTNSMNSTGYIGSGSGSNIGGALGNTGLGWGSSPLSPQGGRNSRGQSGSIGYGGGDNSYSLAAEGYGRSNTTRGGPTSSNVTSAGGYDGSFSDFYGGGSVYGDPTLRSANIEREGSGSFGYGLGIGGASDVQNKTPPGYVGGYGVTKRQPNRGLAG